MPISLFFYLYISIFLLSIYISVYYLSIYLLSIYLFKRTDPAIEDRQRSISAITEMWHTSSLVNKQREATKNTYFLVEIFGRLKVRPSPSTSYVLTGIIIKVFFLASPTPMIHEECKLFTFPSSHTCAFNFCIIILFHFSKTFYIYTFFYNTYLNVKVHDDVIDHAESRRGEESVNCR